MSIDNRTLQTVIKVIGNNDRVKDYNQSSHDSKHNYSDNLKEIVISFGPSSNLINSIGLDQEIHDAREIFSKYFDDDVYEMRVEVLDKYNLGKDRSPFEESNSIHMNFDSQREVLIYSWPRYKFDESKWRNFLLQLTEEDSLAYRFIGAGPLNFKYEGFKYSLHPPAFSFSQIKTRPMKDGKVHSYIKATISDDYEDYESSVFSFSQEEVNKIIEKVKRSHKSIEKKIIDHYKSLGKDFVKAGSASVMIITDINNKTRLSSVICKGRGIDEVKLELYKDTSLHLFAKLGNKFSQQVEDELDKGADVNAMDGSERTPLHYAAKNGHIEIVKILLAAEGIDINARDEDERTPFDLATDEEIKTLLKEAAEKTDDVNPVNKPSTDSEGGQEKDAGIRGEEKQGGDKIVGSGGGTSQTQQETAGAGQETQTEEQSSSFFTSLFYILTKPFYLIVSFIGSFFSWLFGSDEPSTESDQIIVPEPPSSSGGEELTDHQKDVAHPHDIM